MKTLQECKDEVAKKYQFFDWLNLEKRFARSVDTVDNLISVYYDEAAELYASQFNKPPVYGQMFDVKDDLPKSAGNYLVFHNSPTYSTVSIEQFDGDRFSTFTKSWMPLPPSPGSVDVEEKKECQHEALTDTGVGYHHCPTCNASFKVDGLGDSSESEKEFTSQEVFEWFQTKRFQREQGTQEYTMIYEIDLPKIINQFIKDKLA